MVCFARSHGSDDEQDKGHHQSNSSQEKSPCLYSLLKSIMYTFIHTWLQDYSGCITAETAAAEGRGGVARPVPNSIASHLIINSCHKLFPLFFSVYSPADFSLQHQRFYTHAHSRSLLLLLPPSFSVFTHTHAFTLHSK